MSLSTDQITDRRAGLPASDFPAVLGLDPWRSPLHVWLERTGKAAPVPESDRMRWGHLIEPLVRAEWERKRGIVAEQPGTVMRVVGDITIMATPDATSEARGLEVKTHSLYAADYGPEGTDQVPLRVAIQCQIGMWVTGIHTWDVGAFFDGLPHWYELRYDATTAESAVEYALRWWRDHVVAHKAPRPDGTEQTERAIRQMYPGTWRNMPDAKWVDGAALTDQIAAYRAARLAERLAKRDARAQRQAFETLIGDHDGIQWQEGGKEIRLSWRRSRDGAVIDYQSALADFRNRLELVASVAPPNHVGEDGAIEMLAAVRAVLAAGPDYAAFTKLKPGSRRFIDPRAWKSDVPGADEDEEE